MIAFQEITHHRDECRIALRKVGLQLSVPGCQGARGRVQHNRALECGHLACRVQDEGIAVSRSGAFVTTSLVSAITENTTTAEEFEHHLSEFGSLVLPLLGPQIFPEQAEVDRLLREAEDGN